MLGDSMTDQSNYPPADDRIDYHGGDGGESRPTLANYLPPLNRASGQIAGVVKMIEEERGVTEIVRQIMAARSALSRVAQDLLSEEAIRCTDEQCFDDLRDVVKELLR
jgi:DNA-binding FrmR family transcriptional regulator